MKACGIIAEYNPLHNGHVYHMEQARLMTGADAVVVAMSGDYVQRGEPAIIDKWIRTEHALRNGADLVIEIPTLFCLGNAGMYANAGVRLLEATGKVLYIAFGSESDDAAALKRIAETLRDKGSEIERNILDMRGKGFSYPAARELAYAHVRAGLKGTDPDIDPEILSDRDLLSKPNVILAIEYIKAMRNAEPVLIHRKGSGYNDPFNETAMYQSASAIREQALDGKDTGRYVPECTEEALRTCHLTGPDRDKWFDALMYAVLSTDAEIIEDCPSGGEGLANLMKSSLVETYSWTSFINRIKSKRYTYTRLSRLCMQLLLGITRRRYDISGPEYIRVLGFNEMGRKLLAEMRDDESADLPVIINVNKASGNLSEEALKLLELDMHAADIYNLMTGSDIRNGSEHRRNPIIIE